MATDEQDEISAIGNYLAKRRRVREPKRIANIVNGLLAKRGYAQLQSNEELETAWRLAVGVAMANDTKAGKIRRGVLEVAVRNSIVLQELTFRKKELLSKLEYARSGDSIVDLRFRVQTLD